MKKVLFLDLDGTIRHPIAEPTGFISHPFDQQIIAGAANALAKYRAEGWQFIGITNQGGVQKGYKSLSDCIIEQARTIELAGLESVFFCPDFEGNQCFEVINIEQEYIEHHKQDDRFIGQYRKPNAGMLRQAIDLYVPSEILFIGDSEKYDQGAARCAAIPFKFAADWWM